MIKLELSYSLGGAWCATPIYIVSPFHLAWRFAAGFVLVCYVASISGSFVLAFFFALLHSSPDPRWVESWGSVGFIAWFGVGR